MYFLDGMGEHCVVGLELDTLVALFWKFCIKNNLLE
jgi:hypothetical protein